MADKKQFLKKFILLISVLALLPVLIKSNYIIQTLIVILLYAYYASSWNIIGGFAGQMSIGHATYVGLGAYITTILFTYHKLSPWIGMIVAALAAGLISLLIGIPTFKLSGIYFTLSTIAVVNVMRLFFLSNSTILGYTTGAAVGFKIKWLGGLMSMQFLEKRCFYYIILVMLAVVILVSQRLATSKTGYYLAAITTNEMAAASLGINVPGYKLRAQFISAFFTALGGAFYAQLYMFIDPTSVFSYDLSVEMTVLAMVGGRGTVFGPVIGALLLIPLKELTRTRLGASFAGLPFVIYGIILMLTVYFMPNGVSSIVSEKLMKKRNGNVMKEAE